MAAAIEFPFLLEELDGLNVETKPMFGARGVYVDGKIVFIMRDRPTSVNDNGVWLATTGEHHASLLTDFPAMRSIELFGPGPTGWQVLPVDSDDFEDSVLRACRFVRGGDPRIGKIPKRPVRRASLKKKPGANKKSGVTAAKSPPPKRKRPRSDSLQTKPRRRGNKPGFRPRRRGWIPGF